MSDEILVHREGSIATVVLNRPHKLNALTKGMWQRLGAVARQLSAEDDLRCIVLRGAGDKAFSPGNDISEFGSERSNVFQARAYGAVMSETLAALRDCPVPLIAHIKGVCVGGGLEIAALCDLRICGQSSRFGVPISRLGLVMAYPEIEGLLSLVGPAVTRELLLEGRVFDAGEARQKGLVNRVVPDERVDSEVQASAANIIAGAPLVNRWHKKFIRRLADPAPLTTKELEEGYACFGTTDFEAGYRAFLAKTTPQFVGR